MPASAPPRVLLPRPAGRGARLRTLLEEAGCTVEQHPFVELIDVDSSALRTAARELADGGFTHLVLTSPRAVEALVRAQQAGACSPSAPRSTAPTSPARARTETQQCTRDGRRTRLAVGCGTLIWAVGEGTASALRETGLDPALVASGSGAALVEQAPAPSAPTRMLLPLSTAAAPTVPEGLADRGFAVEQVIAYRPDLPGLPAEVTTGLPAGRYTAIVLTSSMIAERAAALGVHPATAVIAIGRPTEQTARTHGLPVTARAEDPSDASLARAVLGALNRPLPDPDGPGRAPLTSPAAPSAVPASPEELP